MRCHKKALHVKFETCPWSVLWLSGIVINTFILFFVKFIFLLVLVLMRMLFYNLHERENIVIL